MTVENQTTKITGNGNGASFVFSFTPMVIFATTNIEVTLVAADGTETLLSEGTSSSTYSVAAASGSYPSATGVTGSVTYPADLGTAIASGVSIVIKRVLTLEQQTDLENQGGYFPDIQETQFDKGVMIDLQQQEVIERAITAPVSDDTSITLELPTASERASQNLTFDSSGNVTVGTVSTSTVSTAMQPVVQATTLALGRAALDVFEDVFVARGDILRGGVSGAEEVLALGTTGFVLISDGTDIVYGQVDTVGITDDAVTLAKMATGTDGELITWSATGDPTTVAVGTSGNVLTSNGTGAAPTFQSSSAGGGLVSVQVFTASGTWTKPANINNIIVEVIGAGGGGAGAASNVSGGGGGGAGYSRELVDSSGLTSETVTVGSGGAGGAAGANNGSSGGTSSLGALLSATGGSGGVTGSTGLAGIGGVGSGGSFNIEGDSGTSSVSSIPGNGGVSHLGGGGRTGSSQAGEAGGNYGGGGGAGSGTGAVARAGGAGAGGIIIVWEYA